MTGVGKVDKKVLRAGFWSRTRPDGGVASPICNLWQVRTARIPAAALRV